MVAFITRVRVKVIADFTGCVHFRKPFELGGEDCSVRMVWAQNFTVWVLLNAWFFLSIEKNKFGSYFFHEVYHHGQSSPYSCPSEHDR